MARMMEHMTRSIYLISPWDGIFSRCNLCYTATKSHAKIDNSIKYTNHLRRIAGCYQNQDFYEGRSR